MNPRATDAALSIARDNLTRAVALFASACAVGSDDVALRAAELYHRAVADLELAVGQLAMAVCQSVVGSLRDNATS